MPFASTLFNVIHLFEYLLFVLLDCFCLCVCFVCLGVGGLFLFVLFVDVFSSLFLFVCRVVLYLCVFVCSLYSQNN